MLSCQVNRDAEGKIEGVYESQGVESKLYAKILSRIDEFKQISNEHEIVLEERNLDKNDNREIALYYLAHALDQGLDVDQLLTTYSEPLLLLPTNQQSNKNPVNNRGDRIIKATSQQIKDLNRRIAVVQNNLLKTDNIEKERRLSKRLAELIGHKANLKDILDSYKGHSANNFEAYITTIIGAIAHEKPDLTIKDGYNEVSHLGQIRAMLNRETLSNDEINIISPLLDMLQGVASIRNPDSHFLLNKSEVGDSSKMRYMSIIAYHAGELRTKLDKRIAENIKRQSSEINRPITEEDIDKVVHDLGLDIAYLRDARMVDDPYFQAITKFINDMNVDFREELNNELDNVHDLINTASPFMNEETFIQKDKDGNYTDNMIHDYSYEELQRLEEFQEHYLYGSVVDADTHKAVLEYKKHLKENYAILDARFYIQRLFAEMELEKAIGSNADPINISRLQSFYDQALKQEKTHIKQMLEHVNKEDLDVALNQLEKATRKYLLVNEEINIYYDKLIKKAVEDNNPFLADEYKKDKDKAISNNNDKLNPATFNLFLDGDSLNYRQDNGNPILGRWGFKFMYPLKEKQDKLLDSRFQVIRDTPELMKLYRFITNHNKEMMTYLSSYDKRRIKENWLPVVSKNILQNFNMGLLTPANIWEKIQKSISVVEVGDDQYIDPITGRPRPFVKYNLLARKKDDIKVEATLRLMEEGIHIPSDKQIEDKMKEVADEFGRDRSWNMKSLIELMLYHNLSYRHRMDMENTIRVFQAFSNKRGAYQKDRFGRIMNDNQLKQEGAQRMIKQLEATIRGTIYQTDPTEEQGDLGEFIPEQARMSRALLVQLSDYIDELKHAAKPDPRDEKYRELNPQDKKKEYETDLKNYKDFYEKYPTADDLKDRISKIIDSVIISNDLEIDSNKFAAALNVLKTTDASKLKSLSEEELRRLKASMLLVAAGAYNVRKKKATRVLQKALIFNQLRGMAFNVFSSLATVLFGNIANTTESSRWGVNERSLDKMRAIQRKGIAKGIGRNKDEDYEKQRNLLKRYDLMTDSRQELSNAAKRGDARIGRVNLLYLEKIAEESVQAPLAAAIFDGFEVELEDGRVITLYEGFDKDMRWNEAEYGPKPQQQIYEAIAKTKNIIDRIQGNYRQDAPIVAKESVVGRMFLQFRTWMIESYSNRFEAGKFKDEEGNDQIKGRYISAYDTIVKGKSNVSSTELFTSIIKEFGMRALAQFTFNAPALFGANFKYRQDEAFGEMFSEIDRRNMYANIKELVAFVQLYAISAILSHLIDDEDDDESYNRSFRLMLNLVSRLETDIALYVNPDEFQKLNKNVIPLFKLLSEILDIKDAAFKTAVGEGLYETGHNAGHVRLFKETLDVFPVGSQIYRGKSYIDQVFDK